MSQNNFAFFEVAEQIRKCHVNSGSTVCHIVTIVDDVIEGDLFRGLVNFGFELVTHRGIKVLKERTHLAGADSSESPGSHVVYERSYLYVT